MSDPGLPPRDHKSSRRGAGLKRRTVRRSDMDFMFNFFTRMSANQLSVADLNYSSSSTFRTYVDDLCSRENSGWKKVVIPVEVEGFRHLKVRRTCRCFHGAPRLPVGPRRF